jgi:hypothetical protein
MRRHALLIALLIAAVAGAVFAADEMLALYKKALADFYAGRFEEAEAQFLTVYRSKPEAPYAPDAVFKAGESAYRLQHWAAAAAHFEYYLRAYPLGSSAPEARIRLEQTRQYTRERLPLPAIHQQWGRLLAAWFDRLSAPDRDSVGRIMENAERLGYNAVVVPAYRLPNAGNHRFLDLHAPALGAFFPTEAAPLCTDLMADLVVAAHKAGLKLIAALPTRAAVAGANAAALDKRWNVRQRVIEPDPAHLDLFQEDNLKRLVVLARDLAVQGVDAIWLDRDLAYAPNEGVSDAVLAEAKRRLRRDVDPAAAFSDLIVSANGQVLRGGARQEYATLCEIRADQITKLVDRLGRAIKEVHPSCRLGVVLPTAAALDQIEGLRDASIDAEALAKLPYDHLVGWADWRAFRLTRGLSGPQTYEAMQRLSAALRKLAGSNERAVVGVQATTTGGEHLLPDWELAEGLTALMTAGPLGMVLFPDIPDRPATKVFEATEAPTRSL